MDKQSLLNELKIDREAAAEGGPRPLRWLVVIALVAGGAFVFWNFRPLPEAQALTVATSVAVAPRPRLAANAESVLDATGYVIARRMATVSSKVTGKVMEVLVEEGMAVEEGQVLARLDDSVNRAQLELEEAQVAAARASVEELRVQIRQAELNLGRTRDLAANRLASQADLDRDELSLEALRARAEKTRRDIEVAERALRIQRQLLEDMQIRAPFSGVVIAKAAQPGEMISPVAAGGGFTATGICTIVDMESLEVEVDVNEAYINRVYPGQEATIVLNAWPDDPYQAEVIAIIPAANRNQATVRVRIGFINRDERVMPEMGVRVAFMEASGAAVVLDADAESAPAPAGVLVPGSAIVREDGASHVWVVADSRVSRRSVELGRANGGDALVLTGLDRGERVVSAFDTALREQLREGLAVTEVRAR
ncbi:MAG: efflux RND transporter periplasmic adaptor subunit [Gammaproteobacteria bacterium]|nr:efflux RND transporter periplasmic adaptor subunit [Gammaproteobacteria bacterium]